MDNDRCVRRKARTVLGTVGRHYCQCIVRRHLVIERRIHEYHAAVSVDVKRRRNLHQQVSNTHAVRDRYVHAHGPPTWSSADGRAI